MKLTSPIKKFVDEPIYTTLPYGDKTFVPQYKILGWDLAFHNGEDFCTSTNPQKAYGTPILASHDGVVDKVIWESPMSTKGNGITISGLPFIGEDGKKRIISTVYWHVAEVLVKAGQFVKAGDEICKMGNSGYVIGSIANSLYKGTHLHFGVYSYIFNETLQKWELEFPNNGVKGAVNPELLLEPNWKERTPIIDEIPKEIKLYPLKWALNKIAEKIKSLFNLWKNP